VVVAGEETYTHQSPDKVGHPLLEVLVVAAELLLLLDFQELLEIVMEVLQNQIKDLLVDLEVLVPVQVVVEQVVQEMMDLLLPLAKVGLVD
jgi:hypothetical protein